MKRTLHLSLLTLLLTLITNFVFAQAETDNFSVAGVCGMCKKKIEKAAKDAGASFADWDSETKMLTIRYNSTKSNTAKIQEAIAKAGYDTPEFRATDKAYNQLHACCKYERNAAGEGPVSNPQKKATESKCAHEGDCKHDGNCSKDEQKGCCKKH